LQTWLDVVHQTFHRLGIERSKELEDEVPVAHFDIRGTSINEIVRGSDGIGIRPWFSAVVCEHVSKHPFSFDP